jgi:hypothetical protein
MGNMFRYGGHVIARFTEQTQQQVLCAKVFMFHARRGLLCILKRPLGLVVKFTV